MTSLSIGKVFKYLPSVKKKDSKRDEEKSKELLTDNSEVFITLFSVKWRSTECYLACIGTSRLEIYIS